MEKNSLGLIIHKTLQLFYPNMRLPVSSYQIEDILDKARITKKNSNKQEISKIIKILKHHIEIAEQNKIKTVEPREYKPIFKSLETDNDYLDQMKEDLAKNLKNLEEKQNEVEPSKNVDDSLIIKNFMEEQTKEFEHRIIIDSKDRDYNASSSSANFNISFGSTNLGSGNEKKGVISRVFEELVSIELTEFIMKDTRGVANASDTNSTPPYLLLQIDELGSCYEGTNNNLNKAFARLCDFEELEMGNGVKFREYQCENFIKVFNPRRNITKLSIRLLKNDGSEYSFGDGDDEITDTMVTLGFKLVVLKKNYVSNYIDKTN